MLISQHSSSTGQRAPMQSLVEPVLPDHRASQESSGSHASIPVDYYGPGARSSAGSVFSQETSATSIHTLPPLQSKSVDHIDFQTLEPVIEDDPSSWDLVAPAPAEVEQGIYALEKRADQLFSSEHLRVIFEDPKLLLKFTGFLNTHRPQSIPILIYYLDALKAIRAIGYANAIAEALEPIQGQGFTNVVAKPTINTALEDKANQAFDVLVQEDLPAYIAHTWIQVVSVSIQRRITGTLAPHLKEASEGLAEVFCLTDPSRADAPIVFASEEFTRTTQYGMNYLIGRNCRFLQGPRTNPLSVQRIGMAFSEGKEHTEIFVNYRRDGSPFLNLLMIAPLMDSRGNIRYYIGAQVDVSGLLEDCSEMEGLMKMVEKEQEYENAAEEAQESYHKDEFQELSEMFNGAELDTVRKCGGRMHKEYVDDAEQDASSGRPRLVIKDTMQEESEDEARPPSIVPPTIREKINGKLEGIYSHVSICSVHATAAS
jgi:PAS domain-containing protein